MGRAQGRDEQIPRGVVTSNTSSDATARDSLPTPCLQISRCHPEHTTLQSVQSPGAREGGGNAPLALPHSFLFPKCAVFIAGTGPDRSSLSRLGSHTFEYRVLGSDAPGLCVALFLAHKLQPWAHRLRTA